LYVQILYAFLQNIVITKYKSFSYESSLLNLAILFVFTQFQAKT